MLPEMNIPVLNTSGSDKSSLDFQNTLPTELPIVAITVYTISITPIMYLIKKWEPPCVVS